MFIGGKRKKGTFINDDDYDIVVTFFFLLLMLSQRSRDNAKKKKNTHKQTYTRKFLDEASRADGRRPVTSGPGSVTPGAAADARSPPSPAKLCRVLWQISAVHGGRAFFLTRGRNCFSSPGGCTSLAHSPTGPLAFSWGPRSCSLLNGRSRLTSQQWLSHTF